MYKYNLSWTTKDGRRVENQLFTAEHISHKLANLEQEECTSIKIELCPNPTEAGPEYRRCVAFVTERAETMFYDDAEYPQVYTELIARHNYHEFRRALVFDVVEYDLGEEVLNELASFGLFRSDVIKIVKKVADNIIAEWEQMTPEEQKEIYDVEEIDKIRAASRKEQVK